MANRVDNFKGMDLTSPLNRIPAGKVALAQNVRAYTEGGFTLRNGLGAPVITVDHKVYSAVKRSNVAGIIGEHSSK